MREVRMYRLASGREPFFSWCNGIRDRKVKVLIRNSIRRLGEGLSVDFKRLCKGVFELRLHYGAGYRIYYATQGRVRFVLLLGGDKGSQKADKAKAVAYWQDYRERYHEES